MGLYLSYIEAVWGSMGTVLGCMGYMGLHEAVWGCIGADVVPYVGGDGPLCWVIIGVMVSNGGSRGQSGSYGALMGSSWCSHGASVGLS